MPSPDEQRDPLEVLAAEFTERLRRGENPSLDEYAVKHPDLAAEIRELFPAVASMERLKAQREGTQSGRASLGAVKLDRLGDYRIVREIGRGGMGIVFEAEQESLRRRVAVKVLPRHFIADPRRLERFNREAALTAALHHTNIVQIFGAGEQEGFEYYVMQYISGPGLDTVIEHFARVRAGTLPVTPNGPPAGREDNIDAVCRRVFDLSDTDVVCAPGRPPSGAKYWRGVAGVGRQVADALAYAHAQGISHRDIKPANLLIDEHGVVMVTDFGLAKVLDPPENLTKSGAITGTLRYMAPEQLQGRTDARSDLYSLGLTLYELITLQPAFADSGRNVFVRRITEGDAPRLRHLNPDVPRDLETIILKATAHNPGHRYPSAAAMADDLQRFMEDRPVLARRTSSIERGWRWCRRNPAVATLTGATALLVALLAVVSSAGYIRTTRALKGEAQQRQEAEANAELAAAALDRIFDRFAPHRTPSAAEFGVESAGRGALALAAPPSLTPETAALLEELLTFYEKLAARAEDDTRLRFKTADANRRVGDIRRLLGQYSLAESAYRRAISNCQRLARYPAWATAARIETARLENELGSLFRTCRRYDEERSAHQRALALLKPAETGPSASAVARFELARTCYFLGTRPLPEPGDENPSRAPTQLQGEPAGRPGEAQAFTGEPPPPPLEGAPPRERIEGAKPVGNDAEMKPYLREAVALLDALTTQYPDNPAYVHLLALCYRDWQTSFENRDAREARENGERAIALLDGLVQHFPDVPDYRLDLCEAYAAFDIRHVAPDGFTEAEKRLRRALEVSKTLVARHPGIPGYLDSRARTEHKLSTLLVRARRFTEAESPARAAMGIQAGLVAQFPDVPYYQVWQGMFRMSLANVLMDLDRVTEARALFEENGRLLSRLLDTHAEMTFLHGLLDRNYRHYSRALDQLHLRDQAAEAARLADQHRDAYSASERK